MSDQEQSRAVDLERRDVLRTGGAAMLAGLTVQGTGIVTPAVAQEAAARHSGPLGARLQGAQHFGLTVQNMDRAYEFCTEVLGGTEVMRDGDFQGERIHNTLLTDQEIEARERQVNPRTLGVPDLEGGAQQLEFVQALGPVKDRFDGALDARRRMMTARE